MGEFRSLTVLVDGGASGCRLQARDDSGQVCGETQSGPASLSLDGGMGTNGAETGTGAWQNVLAGLAELMMQIGKAEDYRPQHLVMGLAGALHDERRKKFLALAKQHTDKVTLVTDGHAQMLGASGGKPGACLAVGTGSVLHWINAKGEPGMAGGWGFPAGDEASGAWLGLLAVNRFTRWYDRARDYQADYPGATAQNGKEDPFHPRMHKLMGAGITDIQTWTTCKSPTQLATLAPVLLQLLEDGSDVAHDIVTQGTRALEQLLEHAPADLPLFLAGGLATMYRSRLGESWQSRLQVAHGNVFDGLWHLAQTTG